MRCSVPVMTVKVSERGYRYARQPIADPLL